MIESYHSDLIIICRKIPRCLKLEGTGAGESDQDHGDGFKGEMCMFQTVDQALFFAGCFLVSVWQREQEYQYEKYNISDSASVE